MSQETTPTAAPPKPKGRQLLKMRVDEIRDYTPEIRELFIKCEEPSQFEFRAGQFVMLHVPPPNPPDGISAETAKLKPALRAYSIASTDLDKSGFRLVFKYVPTGVASEFVWNLKGGETLDFTGPFGRLFFKEPPTEQVVFLNTGSGISQHFCFLESNLKKFPDLKYHLFFGVRTEADTYYQSEMKRLQKSLPNFKFDYVLSRAESDWKGLRGYVQNQIDQIDYMGTPTTFYLCGNSAMIKDTKMKLQEKGFPHELIFAEAFD